MRIKGAGARSSPTAISRIKENKFLLQEIPQKKRKIKILWKKERKISDFTNLSPLEIIFSIKTISNFSKKIGFVSILSSALRVRRKRKEMNKKKKKEKRKKNERNMASII